MSTVLLRRIPFGVETREAWKSVGVLVVPFSRMDNPATLSAWLERQAPQRVINAGLLVRPYPDGCTLYNTRDLLDSVVTPAALRRTIPDLIPPLPKKGQSYWVKGPGQHGNGKTHHASYSGPDRSELQRGYDMQLHVSGIEYRLITVGDRIVQVHRKENIVWTGNEHESDWVWVGVNAVKKGGFFPVIKEAVHQLPDWETALIGWDVIQDGKKVFIIEANSTPGVNQFTAERIMNAMR